MTCDEALYRQYLSGDDEGLNALMKKYGNPLTLYIDGYLHDVHESASGTAASRRISIKRRGLGIHRHRFAGFFTRRMRDCFVLPAAADEP